MDRAPYYKLVNGIEPVPCSWYEAGVLLANPRGRCLAYEKLPNGYSISTAFLVFDHNLLGDEPVLWNTIVTEPSGRQRLMGRYSRFGEAYEGHRTACAVVKLLTSSLSVDEPHGPNQDVQR